MPRIKLSETAIKKLPSPAKGQALYRDEEVSGLALRITATGHRAFVLNYTANRRQRRMTIGDFPTWSATAARERAKELLRKIDDGQDPLEEKQEAARAPTVAALWEAFRQDHLPDVSPKHAKEQERYWRDRILPELGKKKLVDLKSKDVDDLHRSVSKTAPVLANRVVASLRKALSFAKRRDWIERNVAEGTRSNREQGRQRYLSTEELGRLTDGLSRMENQSAADAIRLLLLTGARRSEVLGARWEEFDLGRGIWVKPAGRVKSRKRTSVPLSERAQALLARMSETATSSCIFPNKKGDGPVPDIKRPWAWLMVETGIQDFRIHDLRHTYASILVSQGLSLELIGKLLGHTQAQTTMRYSHLMDDPLRQALLASDAAFAMAENAKST